MYGYLIYDTLFTLMFYEAVGTVAFLLHHCLGLTCCCFGLYFNKMALFGTAIQVFFESTTPLLHLMGCLKLMGRQGTSSYTATGMAFVAQFFVCRVVVANYYWSLMISAVAALDTKPAWAWGGIAVYGVLSGLNLFWFYKLMLLALQATSKQQPKTLTPALQPSPTAAAVTAITATSGQAVAAAVDAASCVSTSVTKAKPLRQRSRQVLAEWLHSSKQKAAAVSGFSSSTLPGLQNRLSECLDSPDSPRIGAARVFGRAVSTLGPAVVDSLAQRAAPVAAESKGWTRAQPWEGGVRPAVSPFAAQADREWADESKVIASDLGLALQTDWHHYSWKAQSQSSEPSLAKTVISEFGPAALAQPELLQSSSEDFRGVRSGLTAGLSGLGPAVLADLELYQSFVAASDSARTETARAAICQVGPAFIVEWTARASVNLSSSFSSQSESVVASIKDVGSEFGPAVVDDWDAQRLLECSPQSLSPRTVVAGLKLAGSEFGPAVLAGLEQR
ncbi:TPA: hypothetical protein ACH3X2_012842 [Trebouxia sp. C0005]